jgi:hypothetical protein
MLCFGEAITPFHTSARGRARPFLFAAGRFGFCLLDLLEIAVEQRVILFDRPARDGFIERGERALAEFDVRAAHGAEADDADGFLLGQRCSGSVDRSGCSKPLDAGSGPA